MLTFSRNGWIKLIGGVFVLWITILVLLACGGSKRTFSPLGAVDNANLWVTANDGSKHGRKISDPKDLSRIVIFVDSQRANWATPWFGTPVPFVEVQLFNGQQPMGSFGVGKHFFATQREGAFYSKGAAPNEVHSFFDALGLDDAAVEEIRNGSDGTGKYD
jgi:hypothetical protein